MNLENENGDEFRTLASSPLEDRIALVSYESVRIYNEILTKF